MTPTLVARKLGATLLLQVNTLERAHAHTGDAVRWNRRILRSSFDGGEGPVADVATGTASTLLGLARSGEAKVLASQQLGITFNATIVVVATGRSAWFYHWSKLGDAKAEARVLIECDQKRCWTHDGPQTPLERDEVRYFAITRSVVQDFVAKLAADVEANAPREVVAPPASASSATP